MNGMDNSVMMSAENQNSLDINQKLLGCSKDELDINYVCSKPCFIETFSWPATAVGNSVLRWWPVTPGWCGEISTTSAAPTHMAHIASFFSLWCGGIAYKLQFVANAFYGGRIGIAFLSGFESIGATVTAATIEAAPKIICDIRSTRACILEVPWAMNQPYLRVSLASRTTTGTSMTFNNMRDISSSTGIVVVYVQNALTLTGQVPSAIDVNVFAYGMNDLEFAIPNCPTYCPVRYQAPAALPISSAPAKDAEGKEEAELDEYVLIGKAQSETDKTPENLNSIAGQAPKGLQMLAKAPKPRSLDRGRSTIGERILNLRALTRMFTLTTSGLGTADGDSLIIDPRWFDFDTNSPLQGMDARVSRIFAFQRGSRRFKIVPRIPVADGTPTFSIDVIMKDVGPPFAPLGDDPTTYGITVMRSFPWFVNLDQTPVIEIATPFYCNWFNDCVSNTEASIRPLIIITPQFNGVVEYDIYSASGDDASFGYLIGPPSMRNYV